MKPWTVTNESRERSERILRRGGQAGQSGRLHLAPCQEGKTLLLVPTGLHDAVKYTCGVAVIKEGMKMVTFQATGPAVSDATVSELETRLGATLPADYREFLQHTNGGVPEPAYVPEPADLGISARGFFSLDVPEGDFSMSRALSTWDGRYPHQYLPIALCEGSNLLLLGVNGDVRNQVVYWDHDAEAEDGEPPRTDNLTPVASSFSALLDSLMDDDPDEAAVQALLDGSTGWVNPGFEPKFS